MIWPPTVLPPPHDLERNQLQTGNLLLLHNNLTMRIPTTTVGGAISKLLSPNGKSAFFPVQSCLSWKYFTTVSPSLDGRSPSKETKETLRLSKLLSQHASDLAMSRREAERLIKSGDVTVAGEVVTVPQMLVSLQDLNNSVIQVHGKPVRFVSKTADTSGSALSKSSLSKLKTRTWLVHKLPHEVVSEFDPQGRPSMLQRLYRGGVGKSGQTRLHLKPIGRLDMSTEGLILVTNDGQYAREMELPASKLHRTYRVRAHGILSDYKLGRIRKGIVIEGVRYAPMKVHVESKKQTKSTNKWLQVTCCEGKNRMIRNVFTHLGLTVTRLIRISYGDYQLQTIPPGMALEIPFKPVKQQSHRGQLFKRKKEVASRDKAESTEASAVPVEWVRNV